MGKSGPTPPAAPDPVATANAQAAMNSQAAQENAKYSAIDMYGPNGNVTYQRDANGVPLSQHTTLDPTNQQTLDVQNQIGLTLSNKAQDTLSGLPTDSYSMRDAPYDPRAVNTSGMSIWNKGASDFAYDPNGYGDVSRSTRTLPTLSGTRARRALDPMFAQQNDRHAQMLQDRGLPIDGQAASQTALTSRAIRTTRTSSSRTRAISPGTRWPATTSSREQSLRSAAIGEALSFAEQDNSDWLQKLNTEQQLRGRIQERGRAGPRARVQRSEHLPAGPRFDQPNQVQAPAYRSAAPTTAVRLRQPRSACGAQMARNGRRQCGTCFGRSVRR